MAKKQCKCGHDKNEHTLFGKTKECLDHECTCRKYNDD